jgi:hypothetical protein
VASMPACCSATASTGPAIPDPIINADLTVMTDSSVRNYLGLPYISLVRDTR